MKMFLFILSLVAILGSPVVVTAPPPIHATPVPDWVNEQGRLAEILSHWPLADQSIIEEVSISVVAWSRNLGVDPLLVLAVMRVENPWLIPDTISSAGAVGLMQVMPKYWSESYTHCGVDLTDVDTNICKGTNVLRYYIDRHEGDFNSAMLAYNGCLSEYCRRYTTDVMQYLD